MLKRDSLIYFNYDLVLVIQPFSPTHEEKFVSVGRKFEFNCEKPQGNPEPHLIWRRLSDNLEIGERVTQELVYVLLIVCRAVVVFVMTKSFVLARMTITDSHAARDPVMFHTFLHYETLHYI